MREISELLNKIHCGDCLSFMREMPDKSVDLVLTDLPYGTTQNEWDKPIPFVPMWEQLCRIKKENSAIIFFGSGMFSAELMVSNKRLWRYNLIWVKNRSTGFLNAAAMPLRSHEDIIIFYSSLPVYNPQMSVGNKNHPRGNVTTAKNNCYGDFDVSFESNRKGNMKFPKSVLFFDRAHPPTHPTEKPVPLLEYLVRTYSNEGDTVLDFCIGSGTTAEACIRSNRNYIGIEKEPAYVEIALKRLEKVNNHKITDFFGVED